ncbi:MAG: ATP-dependent metallopeptidase FtsH/Yme1/Tma family protein [Candidatus Paceibacterota bacterium]
MLIFTIVAMPTSHAEEKSVLLNARGVPYIETLDNTNSITNDLAIQLIKSDTIKKAFIDDDLNKAVLFTDKDVILHTMYSNDSKLLKHLLTSKTNVQIVTLERSPAPITNKTETEDSNLGKMGLLLPLIIVIGGSAVIFELRQRQKRGDATKPKEGETAYQTREGPAGTIPTVTFEDVAGCEEAIEDLEEIVEFLKAPERFEKMGAKVPKGAILVGPPGTGKTLLARAVAGEAKVAFFAASGSDFVEMYVGVGPQRVRELFQKARLAEKAIIFIDEIDAVARSRTMSTKQNANDERENTLNALLNELDGFSKSNIILLAATNRVDILDPAILRPGRLDRKIQVPNPDRRGREKILKVHTKDKPLAKDVDIQSIAKRTAGMSGAELAQVANEAAIEAARNNLKTISASCFSSAVALVSMGRARKSALVTDRDRLITAYHEAGHTLCALLNKDAQNPAGVSITPRGHAGGITWMTGTDNQYMSRAQAQAQLVVAMGGRAGEEYLLDGEFTQGPSSDLQRATQLATFMVTKYGMTGRGLAVRDGEPDKATVDHVEELLAYALTQAKNLVSENETFLIALVNQLLEYDTLESEEIIDIYQAVQPDKPLLHDSDEHLHPNSVANKTIEILLASGRKLKPVHSKDKTKIKKSKPINNNVPEDKPIPKTKKTKKVKQNTKTKKAKTLALD